MRIGVAWAVALGLVALVYLPGLSGGFLFDDFANLRTLGDRGPIDDPLTLLYYLTSGIADPTGRPVALATFLLDARDWPADPFPFKRTNLILHLINGVLIGLVALMLERRLAERKDHADMAIGQRHAIALLAAGLWLAHPLFVSTTLYVVQRHAMLPLTFVMLGLLCWDRAFSAHAARRTLAGHGWAIVGVGAATVLATLSKANGLLAPMLILITAALFHQPLLARLAAPARRSLRWDAALALAVPALLVLVAIAIKAPNSLDAQGFRSFTLGERLLTQPRALIDYLGLLWFPRSGGGGVFVEGFPKSTGLFEPWTTLPALLAVFGLIALAIASARSRPRVALALSFFFAGHLMESSVIMLELYFEHRNYLPSAFLFWPLAAWLLAQRRGLRTLRLALVVLIPAALLLLTWQRAQVWGDPALLAALAAGDNPDSPRAQTVRATALATAGDSAAASETLLQAIETHGPTTLLALNLVDVKCRSGTVDETTLQLARESLVNERRWHQGVIDWLGNAMQVAESGRCRGLTAEVVGDWLDASRDNRASQSSATRRQNLLFLQARFELLNRRPEAALALFDTALTARPNPDTALTQAATLGRWGEPALGLRHLDHFENLRAGTRSIRSMTDLQFRLLQSTGYFDRELTHLRRLLQEDAERASRPQPGDGPRSSSAGSDSRTLISPDGNGEMPAADAAPDAATDE